MWPRFFFKKIKNKKLSGSRGRRAKEGDGQGGGRVCITPARINGGKSNNTHPGSIMPKWRVFQRKHNGADIVNWQVEKGGFRWK